MDEHCKLAIDRLASFSNRIMPYLVNHPPDSFNYYSSAHAYIIWYSIFAVVFLQAWESDSPTRITLCNFFPKMSQLQVQLFRTCLARTEPNEPLPYYRLGRTAIDRKRTRTSRCPSAEAPRRPSVTTTRPWARVCWAWNSTSPGSTSNSEVRRRNSCRELNELCGLQRTPPRPSTAL